MSARPLWCRSLRSTYPTGVGGSPAAPLAQTKKPGHMAPAVSLDYPGSSSRASGWIRRTGRRRCQPSLAPSCAIPGSRHPSLENDHPWSLPVAFSLATSLHQMEPSLVVSRGPPGRNFRNTLHKPSIQMTVPGRHLHVRCITKLVSSPYSSSGLSYSSNGNAVVYLFLRNTKLVFTWCTALQGIICSRSSFSYARMLLHAIFK